jgi:hypothetical protein
MARLGSDLQTIIDRLPASYISIKFTRLTARAAGFCFAHPCDVIVSVHDAEHSVENEEEQE